MRKHVNSLQTAELRQSLMEERRLIAGLRSEAARHGSKPDDQGGTQVSG